MTTYQKIMLAIGLVGLAVALLIPLVISVTPQLKKVRKIFFFAVTGLTLYAGAKWMPTVTYPAVGDVNYLIDRGSYVTNDYVHIDFSTVVIPTNANLYIFRKALDIAEAQWVEHLETTIGEFNPPQDIYFPTASNYNWMVFSDWTPGPAVETNGVWHAYWGLDLRRREKLIPIRTCIRLDNDIIATPGCKPYDAEVEYLENATSGAYIDTGYFINWDEAIAINVSFLAADSNSKCLLSSYKKARELSFELNGRCRFWAFGNDIRSTSYFPLNQINRTSICYYNGSWSLTLNSEILTGAKSFSGVAAGSLLMFVDQSKRFSTFGPVKIYEATIDAPSRSMHLIPVRFTNELGETEGAMYDKISGQLFRNRGTGKFAIGPDKQ